MTNYQRALDRVQASNPSAYIARGIIIPGATWRFDVIRFPSPVFDPATVELLRECQRSKPSGVALVIEPLGGAASL